MILDHVLHQTFLLSTSVSVEKDILSALSLLNHLRKRKAAKTGQIYQEFLGYIDVLFCFLFLKSQKVSLSWEKS